LGEVADHHMGAAAVSVDLLGDVVEFGPGSGGDDDVRTGFGEAHRDRGTETAAGTGDDRYLIVEPESI